MFISLRCINCLHHRPRPAFNSDRQVKRSKWRFYLCFCVKSRECSTDWSKYTTVVYCWYLISLLVIARNNFEFVFHGKEGRTDKALFRLISV